MRDVDVDAVRAFMSTVCLFAPESKHFCIHQSGLFWQLLDDRERQTEVVVYKVGRLLSEATLVRVEIEARHFKNPEEALQSIDRIEKILELEPLRSEKSIAELFCA